MRRVAVIGSRRPKRAMLLHESLAFDAMLEDVRMFVRTLPRDTVVVSGDAPGVDTAAEDEAIELGMLVVICPVRAAAWKRLGKAAGHIRNGIMAEIVHEAVAFRWEMSRGTTSMIEWMAKAGKPCDVRDYPLKEK